MPDPTQIIGTASAALYDLIYAGLLDERGVHLETAVAAAAHLAGYQLQLDSGVNLANIAPGSAVLNLPGVDERGPMVVDYLVQACTRQGLPAPAHAELTVPAAHKPLRTHQQLMETFAAPYRALVASLELKPELLWIVPTQACVRFIVAGQKALSSQIALALAMEAMVAGAKTAPPKFETTG